tara:strand:- start:24 stop:719 length:696 start_codon:yes stop_codon:yes gene_type:complete
MPRTTKASGFASAIKKAVNGDSWEASRSVSAGGGNFERDEVDDGTYVARLTSGRTGQDKNGNPYAAFDFEIGRGEFTGCTVSKFHSIAERGNRTYEQALSSLFTDLKRMEPEEDFDTFEPEDIESLVEDLVEEGPVLQIAVKNTISGERRFTNVYVNRRLDDEELPQDAEDWTPAKGDAVSYKPPRARKFASFDIVKVNKSQETATITNGDKTFEDVAWADLQWDTQESPF